MGSLLYTQNINLKTLCLVARKSITYRTFKVYHCRRKAATTTPINDVQKVNFLFINIIYFNCNFCVRKVEKGYNPECKYTSKNPKPDCRPTNRKESASQRMFPSRRYSPIKRFHKNTGKRTSHWNTNDCSYATIHMAQRG